MQFASKLMQQLDGEGEVTCTMQELVLETLSTLLYATTAVIIPAQMDKGLASAKGDAGASVLASMPEAAALFLSPHYLNSLALATGVTVFGLLRIKRQNQAAAAASSSTSSSGTARLGSGGSNRSGSSNSNSRIPALYTAAAREHMACVGAGNAWKQADEMQRDLTPCQQQLFELLGVNSRVVLWAAAAFSSPKCDAGMHSNDGTALTTACLAVSKFWHLDPAGVPQLVPQQQQQKQQQQKQQQQQQQQLSLGG
jgi:hypothetical protein